MKGVIRKVSKKGYGFIGPSKGKTDIFFHCTALPNKSDFDLLEEGMEVEYEISDGTEGRIKAVDIRFPE